MTHEEMCQVVNEYFRKLFDHSGRETLQVESTNKTVISEEQNNELVADFTFDEFTTAIKQMYSNKSSGPDGPNQPFFKIFGGFLTRKSFAIVKAGFVS